MNKNSIKYLAIPLLLGVLLFGCGGSGSDSDDQKLALVLGEVYDEKPGDIFTTSLSMDITTSDGQSKEFHSVDVRTYSQVPEIPSKYAYSNIISGPYLLETTNEDDELDGLSYMTPSGDMIIDDDLDYYTNIDYTTETGSEKPENIYIGDKYSFYQKSTLFNSQSGVEAGYEITNTEFSVLSEEQIKIPAGKFNAVKIEYSNSNTTLKDNILDTLSATGYGWFDTTNGYALKMTMNGDMTLGNYDQTATFSSSIILIDYFISSNEESNQVSGLIAKNTLSNSEIKVSNILLGLKNGIRDIQYNAINLNEQKK